MYIICVEHVCFHRANTANHGLPCKVLRLSCVQQYTCILCILHYVALAASMHISLNGFITSNPKVQPANTHVQFVPLCTVCAKPEVLHFGTVRQVC